MYALFVGIHLYGVGEALKLIFVITAIAAVALLAFVVGMIPKFDAANLTNIAPNDAAGASDFLPFGYAGILAAFVYGIWFFLAIEGVPLAAEEARNPARDMPRGLIVGMLVLLLFAALILVFAAGGSGADVIKEDGNPLVTSLETAYDGKTGLSRFVNAVGLLGLIASFFSIIYGYSRQLFALSRAGYLPTGLSVTSRRKVPSVALLVPGVIGLVLACIVGEDGGGTLIQIAVFGATVSYVLMMISHIVLRVKEPGLERPYRTPGGIVTSSVALFLACAAVVAVFFVDEKAALITLGVYAAFIAYFLLYSRTTSWPRRPRRSSPHPGLRAGARAMTLEELERAVKDGRRDGHPGDDRHAGPPAGQAPDAPPLPRRDRRPRRGGVQLPPRRGRRDEHGRGLLHVLVGGRLRRLRVQARPQHAAPDPMASGHRPVPRGPRVGRWVGGRRLAPPDPAPPARPAGGAGLERPGGHRARVHHLPRHLRAGVAQGV
jgi:ethanolamine permease